MFATLLRDAVPAAARHQPALEIETVHAGRALEAADSLLRERRRSGRPGQSTWRAADGLLKPSYLPPQGALLVAWLDGEPAGCIALRESPVAEDTGEATGLFVRPLFGGHGVARALLRAVGLEARRLGYRRLRLETSDRPGAARRLHLAWGFAPLLPGPLLPVRARRPAAPGRPATALPLA